MISRGYSWSWVVGCAVVLACSPGRGGEGDGSKVPEPQLTRRDTSIDHEPCGVDGAGAQRLDANGDGRADITIVREGQREICRAVDLNLDGGVDTWVYRDPAGNVRRRENDYDRDGRIDEVLLYRGGVLVEKRRATTLSGQLDTWHYYEGGRLRRTERDANGDAVIDEWWEYPMADKPNCPLIHSDVNGDGRPDPGASVDVCADDSTYRPPEPIDRGPKAFDFEGSQGQLPTEVSEESDSSPDSEGAGTPSEQAGDGAESEAPPAESESSGEPPEGNP